MAGKLGKPCKGLRCAEIVERGDYCTKHQGEARATRFRGVKDRFYDSSEWRTMRTAFIVRHPVCNRCKRSAATEVHHVQSRRDNPELALTWENLEALCSPCHKSETAREIAQRQREMAGG